MNNNINKLKVNGDVSHYKNGMLHNEDGPAVEKVDGTKIWYFEDKIHRDDGPAIIYGSGTKSYFKHGVVHRENGPAIEFISGDKCFYIDGVQLTEKQFAEYNQAKIDKKPQRSFTTTDGTEWHYKGGKLNRDDGPAIIYTNGYKQWFKNGELHREDGPAIECGDKVSYHINGKYLTKEQFESRDSIMEETSNTTNTTIKKPKMPMIKYANGNREWINANEHTSITIDKNGTIYHKLNDQLHKEGSPAVIYRNGNKHWFKYGKMHRYIGPAIEHMDGLKEYWIDGKLNREDGPAISAINNSEYFLDGKKLTPQEYQDKMEEKTAKEILNDMKGQNNMNTNTPTTELKLTPPNVEDFVIKPEQKDTAYYNYNMDGEKHNLNGPAVIKENGDKFWYQNDLLHREDGPAAEYANGDRVWYQNGRLHRFDGPAIEYVNGHKEWYFDGYGVNKTKIEKDTVASQIVYELDSFVYDIKETLMTIYETVRQETGI
jgi:hypothetical protein